MDSTDQNISHETIVSEIVFSHFGVRPELIERMKIGNANEVYAVRVEGEDYIVRLNQRDSIKGSSIYMPLFRSKGIKVPEIVAEDYSKKKSPYNWQIQTRLPGEDIGNVISHLSHEELDGIAAEIANVVKSLIVLPTNGMYGWTGESDRKLRATLVELTQAMLDTTKERAQKYGVVKEEYIKIFERTFEKYKSYMASAPSQFYFDDMSSKNVMIYDGQFSGLVDLDGVAYGDYLEAIGRIKANWYDTEYGTYYQNAVMDALKLDDYQREIVYMWALLTRIYWQSEIGIEFNQNSPKEIDPNKVEEGNRVIEGLAKELGI